MTDAQKELLESQDRDLDAISSVLSDLKQISLRTGSEVNSQSKKIDDITVSSSLRHLPTSILIIIFIRLKWIKILTPCEKQT